MKKFIDNESTIAAISTPAGPGGIGIIKISGMDALQIARSIFKRTGANKGGSERNENSIEQLFESHKLVLGNIIDPENGNVIDEVLLTYMKKPKSYTMEDVVEINAHAGPVVLNAILGLVLKNGARIAEPGEFTKRAFLSGRIDLTQAEAVVDIIQSKTEKSLEIAVSQAGGYFGRRIEKIRNSLQEIRVSLEAAIEFPEDAEDDFNSDHLIELLEQSVVSKINELIQYYNDGSVIRHGLKLCITGKPNVGKSSLLNCLVRKDRAIVTSIPGTTRDVVEEVIDIDGIPVSISDTAGLHETEDPVEVIGMNKAWDYIIGADVILFMIDVSSDVDTDDKNIFERISEKKIILVINKSDLVDENYIPGIPDEWKELPKIKISALYDKGVEELRDLIKEVSIGQTDEIENAMIPNLRQKCALEKSQKAVHLTVEGLRNGLPGELVSMDIGEAIDSLGEILGINTGQDILGEIFSRFCIGK
ncbi:MAG: tRNA uridine-5-carboxymethylaminomethyl(34) synthesis GTPase MnmE [Deltaproteobacteria bacterium]|nr:tRNA uridine-5-carboxymethylaminomethyl(34) synthesis GTPase MnmE [Deltaproteobacteria bacterium]